MGRLPARRARRLRYFRFAARRRRSAARPHHARLVVWRRRLVRLHPVRRRAVPARALRARTRRGAQVVSVAAVSRLHAVGARSEVVEDPPLTPIRTYSLCGGFRKLSCWSQRVVPLDLQRPRALFSMAESVLLLHGWYCKRAGRRAASKPTACSALPTKWLPVRLRQVLRLSPSLA